MQLVKCGENYPVRGGEALARKERMAHPRKEEDCSGQEGGRTALAIKKGDSSAQEGGGRLWPGRRGMAPHLIRCVTLHQQTAVLRCRTAGKSV